MNLKQFSANIQNIKDIPNINNCLVLNNLCLRSICTLDNYITLVYEGCINPDNILTFRQELIEIFKEASSIFVSNFNEDTKIGFDYNDYTNTIYISLGINGNKEDILSVFRILKTFARFIETSLDYTLDPEESYSSNFIGKGHNMLYNASKIDRNMLKIQNSIGFSKMMLITYTCSPLRFTCILIFNIFCIKDPLNFYTKAPFTAEYNKYVHYAFMYEAVYRAAEAIYNETVQKEYYNITVPLFNYTIRGKYKNSLVKYTSEENRQILLNYENALIEYIEILENSLIISCAGGLSSSYEGDASISYLFKDQVENLGRKLNIPEIYGGLYIEKNIVNFMISVKGQKITFELLLQVLDLLQDNLGLKFETKFAAASSGKEEILESYNLSWLRGSCINLGDGPGFYITGGFINPQTQFIIKLSNDSVYNLINKQYSVLYMFFFDLFVNLHYYILTASSIWFFDGPLFYKILTSVEATPEFFKKLEFSCKQKIIGAARCCAYYENGIHDENIIKKYISKLAIYKKDITHSDPYFIKENEIMAGIFKLAYKIYIHSIQYEEIYI